MFFSMESVQSFHCARGMAHSETKVNVGGSGAICAEANAGRSTAAANMQRTKTARLDISYLLEEFKQTTGNSSESRGSFSCCLGMELGPPPAIAGRNTS